MALLIPLTYSLDPYAAFALLLGMGSVTTTSDTIPAVLFGVPGTVGAAATVLDGHAMAKKGEAARALGAAYSASLIGGVFGALIFAAAIPIMRPLVLYLKTPDFFAISAFGLSIVAMLAGQPAAERFRRGNAGTAGVFRGHRHLSGFDRWTFGRSISGRGCRWLWSFSACSACPNWVRFWSAARCRRNHRHPAWPAWRVAWRTPCGNSVGPSLQFDGCFLGAVPGSGVAVVDWIAYGHAARRPGNGPRVRSGKRARGDRAGERQNAKEGGSLIPTIAFGVPGSASMGLLLGAFVIQGLGPGTRHARQKRFDHDRNGAHHCDRKCSRSPDLPDPYAAAGQRRARSRWGGCRRW